jgi:AraC-like DNA-binding protein
MNVHILSESEGNIILSDSEPTWLWEYKLPESRSMTASGAFGDLLLQETPGHQYSVWYNNYQLKRGDRLTIIRPAPVYTLRFILNNSFNYYDPKVGSVPMHERGYNLLYAGTVPEKISFKDKSYTNLEIHFARDYLASFSPHFAHLAEWLRKAEKQPFSRFCKVNQVATADMMRCIKELLNCPYTGALREMHYDALVRELLISVLYQTANYPMGKIIRFTTKEVETMYELKTYLLTNRDKPLKLEELASMYAITTRTLKRRFHTLFGVKLYNFLLDIRMEQASMLLLETDTSIEQIAMLTGYQSFANFSTAFKKYYGHPPKYFRSR